MGKGKDSKHGRKNLRADKMDGVTRIPPEQMKSYRVVNYSDTTNPYTAAEIQALLDQHKPGDLFDVDPNRLRFMHAGVADEFSDGKVVADVIQKLSDDPTYIRHMPPVMLAAVELPIRKWEVGTEASGGERELMLFTEDHRRVVAAREAGIPLMKAQMKADPTVVSNFTTKTLGMRLEVRHYQNREDGAHQGGNKPTIPGSAKIYRY
jgi:hypothetical protein